MDLEKIINFDWEKIIADIIKGLKNFVEKLNALMPKSYYNFEKPEEYEF